jgi:hypothetical protein
MFSDRLLLRKGNEVKNEIDISSSTPVSCKCDAMINGAIPKQQLYCQITVATSTTVAATAAIKDQHHQHQQLGTSSMKMTTFCAPFEYPCPTSISSNNQVLKGVPIICINLTKEDPSSPSPIRTISSSSSSLSKDLNKRLLCEFGDLDKEWTVEDMRDHFRKFEAEVFSKGGEMTINNEGGMGMFHGWFISYVIYRLKPKHIIESGAHTGRGTWLLRQAAPHAQIIVISPENPTAYRDKAPDSIYFTGEDFKDFTQIDFDSLKIDKKRTLVFLDDHQAGERRIREARERGFLHLIFDDNYIAGCNFNCDNFSAKQACDANKRELWNVLPVNTPKGPKPNEYFYDDNFGSSSRKYLSVPEMDKIFHEFKRMLISTLRLHLYIM